MRTGILRLSLARGLTLVVLAGSFVALASPPQPAKAADTDACSAGAAENSITASPSHGQVFYIDSGITPRIDASYVGYRISNASGGATRKDIWVELTGFSTASAAKVFLSNTDDKYQQLGALSANTTKTAFFLLKALGPTTTPQKHIVKVWEGRPDLTTSTRLFSCYFQFLKVSETIKARANKVTGISVASSSATPQLGGSITVTVTGATGTIGAGSSPDNDIVWLTPAAYSSWPTRALRLENTTLQFYSNPSMQDGQKLGPQYNDLLFIKPARAYPNGATTLNFNSKDYKAVYTFRIIGSAPATSAAPVAQISSGTQIKHSATDNLPSNTIDLSGVNKSNISVTKAAADSASLTVESGKAVVTYTITVSTTSTSDVKIDEVVDVASTFADYKAGTGKFWYTNDTATTPSIEATLSDSEINLTPRPRHFIGPFTISSSKSLKIEYKMLLPCSSTSASYSNQAYAYSGDQKIGTDATKVPQVKYTLSLTGGVCGGSGDNTPTSFDPSVETLAESPGVTDTSATINGKAILAGYASMTVWFEYGLKSDLSDAIATSNQNVTADGFVSASLTTLTGGKLYYFRVKGKYTKSVTEYTVSGDIFNFQTKTTVIIAAPTRVMDTVNTLVVDTTNNSVNSQVSFVGRLNPNSQAITRVQFVYATSTTFTTEYVVDVYDDDGSNNPPLLTFPANLGSEYQVKQDWTGTASVPLRTNTTYYVKLRVTCTPNGGLCGSAYDSEYISFKVGSPSVETYGASNVTATTANLTGFATSPSKSMNVSFAYCASSATCTSTTMTSPTATANQLVGSSFSEVVTSEPLTGLTPNTTYYFYIKAVTVVSGAETALTATGAIVPFKTLKQAQTITFNSISDQTYGSTVSLGATAPGGTVTYTSAGSGCSLAGTTVTIVEPDSVCTVYANQDGAGTSYEAAPEVSRTFHTLKKPITTTATGVNKVYDGATSATITLSSVTSQRVGTDDVSVTTSDFDAVFDSASVGNSKTVTVSFKSGATGLTGSRASYYTLSLSSSTTTANVTAKPITIKANDASKVANGSNPTFSYSISCTAGATQAACMASGETINSVTYTFTGTGTTTPPDAEGSYTITPSAMSLNGGKSSSNYAVTYETGTFSVTSASKTNQTITFVNPNDKTYGAAAHTLGATTNATGLTVTYTYSGVCSVTGSGASATLSFSAAGSCTVTAQQAGDTTYNPAVSVSYTITVNPKPVTVAITPNNKVYDGSRSATASYGSIAKEGSDDVSVDTANIELLFDTADVGNGKTVTKTVTGSGLTGAKASSYTLTLTITTANVTAKAITIRANSASKTVGKATPSFGYTVSCAGGLTGESSCLVSGERLASVSFNFTVGGSVTSTAPDVVGTHGLNPSSATLTESKSISNYDVTFASANYVINPKASQTITFTSPGTKTYGDAQHTLGATTSATGLLVTYTASGNCAITGDAGSEAVRFTGAGSCTVTASQGGDADYDPAIDVVRTFTINAKPITIKADAKSKTYGAANPTFTYSVSCSGGSSEIACMVGSDQISSVTFTFTGTGTTTPPEAASDYTITPSAAALVAPALIANYSVTYDTGVYTINKASQTITFANPSDKTYGAAAHTLGATTNASGLTVTYTVSGACSVSGTGASATLSFTAAGSCTVTAKQAGNSNVDPASDVPYTITINAKAITIKADAQSKNFGASNPTFTYSVSCTGGATEAACMVGAERISSVTYTFSGTGTTTPPEAVGSYVITPSGASLVAPALIGNYAITYDTGAYNINSVSKSNQLITFTTPGTKTYGDSAHTLGATTDATGLVVSYTVSGACSVSGTGASATLTFSSAGSCTITAQQAGNGTYNPATDVSHTITINPKPVTVTVTVNNKVYDSLRDAIGSYGSIAKEGLDDVSVDTGNIVLRFNNADAGTGKAVAATVTGSGLTGAKASSYSLTLNVLTANITARTITLTVSSHTITSGDASPTFTWSITRPAGGVGLVGSDAIGSITRQFEASDGSRSTSTPTAVGTYTIIPSAAVFSTGLSTNYDITYSNGSYEIRARAPEPDPTPPSDPTPISQTIDFPPIPDQNFFGSTVTVTPRATASSGLPVSYSVGPASVCRLVGSRVEIIGLGTCFITASQPGDGTYAPAPNVTIAISVTFPVTVTAENKSKVQGATDPVLTYLVSRSLLAGDTFAGALTRVAGEAAGTYSINQGTLALRIGYVITFVQGTFTITARTPQTITFPPIPGQNFFGSNITVIPQATASSRLPITYTVGPASVCRLVGTSVEIIGLGTCSITADQPGDATYAPAPSVTVTIAVTFPVTVTAEDKTKAFSQVDPALTYVVSRALLPGDSFTGAIAREAGEAAGVYVIKQGTLALRTGYVITFVSGKFTILARTVIRVDGLRLVDKVYDSTTDAVGDWSKAVITGIKPGDDVQVVFPTLVKYPSPNAGSYSVPIVATLTGTKANDYVLEVAPATGTIEPRVVTLKMGSARKTEGDPDPRVTYVIENALPNENPLPGGVTVVRGNGESVGKYEILAATPSGQTLTNYIFKVVPGQLEIVPDKPEFVSTTYTPLSMTKTLVQWQTTSIDVKSYEVTRNGVQICATTNASCVVPIFMGPKSKVEVTVIENDGDRATSRGSVLIDKLVDAMNVLFDTDKSVIKTSAKKRLTEVGNLLKREGYNNFVIDGFTDSTWTDAYNKKLSRDRAIVVKNFLENVIDDFNVTLGAFGKSNPVASNNTEAGRAQNRRTSLRIAQPIPTN